VKYEEYQHGRGEEPAFAALERMETWRISTRDAWSAVPPTGRGAGTDGDVEKKYEALSTPETPEMTRQRPRAGTGGDVEKKYEMRQAARFAGTDGDVEKKYERLGCAPHVEKKCEDSDLALPDQASSWSRNGRRRGEEVRAARAVPQGRGEEVRGPSRSDDVKRKYERALMEQMCMDVDVERKYG
jgi:hypothetical protein